MTRFTRSGKQVLLHGEHFADAVDEIAAMMVFNALAAMDRKAAIIPDGYTLEPIRQGDAFTLDLNGETYHGTFGEPVTAFGLPVVVDPDMSPDHWELRAPPTYPPCQMRREGDEFACSCGRRWGIDEDDPHGA